MHLSNLLTGGEEESNSLLREGPNVTGSNK